MNFLAFALNYIYLIVPCTQRLREYPDINTCVQEFADRRRLATDCLADLCLEHYNDMAANTASSLYLLYKRLEGGLGAVFPNHFATLYSLVAFSRTPYDDAVKIIEKQDKFLRSAVFSSTLAVGGALIGLAAWMRYFRKSA
jgi:hypothetical protein